jgi:hypothetical protein
MMALSGVSDSDWQTKPFHSTTVAKAVIRRKQSNRHEPSRLHSSRPLHCIALHSAARCSTALHYTALHCTALRAMLARIDNGAPMAAMRNVCISKRHNTAPARPSRAAHYRYYGVLCGYYAVLWGYYAVLWGTSDHADHQPRGRAEVRTLLAF